jgi:microcystin-dependent protein
MSRPIRRIASTVVLALAAIPGAWACPPDSYMGSVCTFAFARCPAGGWAPADGALLPIKGNEKLFELLQTTYGGDGVGTFALPDLRGRVVANAGKGPGLADVKLGDRFGTEEVPFDVGNLPPHEHPATSEAAIRATLRGQTGAGNKVVPTSNAPAKLSSLPSGAPPLDPEIAIYGIPGPRQNGQEDYTDMHSSSIASSATVTTTTGLTGGGQPLGNLQATLVMFQCIRINGPVPPRP